MKYWLVPLLVLLCFLAPQPILASSQEIWHDSFDSDLQQWQEVQNAQHSQPENPCRGPNETRYQWQLQESTAYLGIENSSPCSVVIVPSSPSVQDMPAFAVSFSMKLQHPQQDRNWMLRWKDKNNYLGFHIFGNTVYPEKVLAGQPLPWGEPFMYPFEGGNTYAIRLEYDQSLRRVRLFVNHERVYEFISPSSDEQLLEGKPGLAGSVGAAVTHSYTWYDDFTVESVGSTFQLPVSGLKQTDARWKETLYDHADRWSPDENTIERWGCALVSAVMTLRYHGLKTLPDGNELTPLTLNSWLKVQPDGYLNQGHLNWRALTRLSWELQAQYGTPKLEFRRYEPPEEEKFVWLRETLSLGLPIILEQPGHFVVASGHGPGEGQIFLEDPFYDRSSLADYQDQYRSARVFTPSNTDLSAVLIAAPLNNRVEFLDTDGVPLSPDQTWIEPPMKDALSGSAAGPSLQMFEFFQPNDLEFKIVAHSSIEKLSTLTILTYQENGNVTRKDWMVDGKTPTSSLDVQYRKQSSSQFEPTPTPVLEESSLLSWLQSGELGSPLLLTEIMRLQEEIQGSATVSDAEASLRHTRLLLHEALRGGWIEAPTIDTILEVFRRRIRDQFP